MPDPAQPVPLPAPDPAEFSLVRPYVLTRGRTRSRFPLPLEALVSAVPGAPLTASGPTHRAVVELCRVPRSVAEVAAVLGVPLGVARVLIDDLAAGGALTVHRTAGTAGPDQALLERVLSGLRRL